eukprot:558829-Prymnesium_polylepis.1
MKNTNHSKNAEIGFIENDGLMEFYGDGKAVREEYRSPHMNDGVAQFYEDGKVVRFFKNGNHVRTEFAKGHPYHGKICFYDDGKHVSTEYAKGHKDHGKIVFCKDDKLVRTEFAKNHQLHGIMIVMLVKPTLDTKLGIRLTGEGRPRVIGLTDSGIAAKAGVLEVGDVILTVNGHKATGRDATTK